jgi:predicted metal-dependent hydrolase
MHEYTLIKSDRKTIQIRITRKGVVEVRAPLNESKAKIDQFVQMKENWIDKHLKKIVVTSEEKDKYKIDYRHKILYRGKEYPIIPMAYGNKVWLDEKGFRVRHGFEPSVLRQTLIRMYKALAKQYIIERTHYFAKIMGLEPDNVRVSSAATRWGSCSSKGSINFSWRLIMAEDEVIDAIIVHELAHLKQMNHSKKFYDIVYKIMPDYDIRKRKLRELETRLAKEEW